MKTKFYSISILFFTLLCSVGFAGALRAQQINMAVEDFTTGGDGTVARAGNELIYTIKVISGSNPLSGSLIAGIPAGTIYKAQSTVVDGNSRPDVNGMMPYVNGDLIMLPANSISTVQFRAIVTANTGTITYSVIMQLSTGLPLRPNAPATTQIETENSCQKIYSLTTETESGTKYVPIPKPPKTVILPYQYIRTVSLDNTTPVEDVYDGTTGLCRELVINWSTNTVTQTDVAAGSILTDGAAMAFYPHYYRLYFVNKSANGLPGDLCYIDMNDPATGTAIAYQYKNMPLFNSTASEVTRMTIDARGNGYALTESGRFIHFTTGFGTTNIPNIDLPATLTPDPSNGTHNFLAETGGDICSDGSGKLYFVPTSGNVYVIDPAIYVIKYVGTITGLPAEESRAVALDGAGYFYISGFYEGIYKVALSTLIATRIPNIVAFASSDFAGCAAPVTLARIGNNTTTVTTPVVSAEVFAKVQPNPFHSQLNLQVQLNTTEQVRVKLIDFFGRTVYTTSEKMTAGVNSLRLPVPVNLSAGIYVVELWTGDKRLLQKKIVKQ